ncbi:MAG: ABC transporter ATP-binding protein [Candidatus Shapirobacteria bacterium]|nr:ABC transporter ATP-binding protein [Candidatus Shapirobacteria bacterium]
MKLIFKFYQFLGKYKLRMALFLGVVTIGTILETIRPYWLKMILNSSEAGKVNDIYYYLGMFGLSVIVGNLISAYGYYLSDRILVPLSSTIREVVFQKIMELDFAYHVDKSTGSLISAFRRGDSAVFTLFFNIHNELYRVLIGLIVTLYFLTTASWEIAGVLGVLFLFNIGLMWWLIARNLKTRSEFNKADDEVAGVIADGMINYETVKFFAAEIKERKRLSFKLIDWGNKLLVYGNSFRAMDIVIGTVSGLGVLLMLWMTINKLGKGLTNGDMIMVAGFVTGFYYQFFNLFFKIREIAKSTTDLEKYMGILDNEIKVKDPRIATKRKVVKGKIEFINVGFVYPKNKQKILDNISIKINSGERVALVGRSGAGKTTLIKLLLRFYDVSEGVIKIDGINIKRMRKTTLRSLMGVVPQEPIMFNNTIKFNLAYGKDEASMEEIREAASKANILEFIEKLDKGWETEVGERGIKLSGGQKQRLAIARAMLADPKILIFDEATSNLDSESERMIQGALNQAAKSRTVIVIAHRFSTIRGADKIIVLSNGNVVEEGKHDELIKKGGIYKMLWTLQAKGKLPNEENKIEN